MARLKITSALFLALGVLGLTAVVVVPVMIYRSGTSALPAWPSVASPGPLSAAHAFLGTQCESCHTPNRGIQAASCIGCHVADASVLAKQSTAFHATIRECRGCHVEHQSGDRRPTRIDHSILTKAGLRVAQAGTRLPVTDTAQAIQRSVAGITGRGPSPEGASIECVSCHSFHDKHIGLFGQQCADCHASETWKIAGFLHPSPRSQDCNECHQPPPSHYMMHFAMMDRGMTGQGSARVEQCYLCHQTDAFNDIKGLGWFKMH